MIRKATINDAGDIQKLIQHWAKKRRVLNRSLNTIYENLRDFWVYEKNKKIVACCALHCVGWDSMGEIKSLIVSKQLQGKGIGRLLVQQCLQEAKSLGIKKVFALTFVPDFFYALGFSTIDMKKLPHKIWTDCVECVYFPDCKEQAVLKKIADVRLQMSDRR